MKNILKPGLVLLALATGLTGSAETDGLSVSYYGYSPFECSENNINAQGTGKNGYIENAIMLDPAADATLRALKGRHVIGLRCFLRDDYKNKNKGTSTVNVRVGSLDAEPVRQAVDFSKGWNEVTFTTPIEIGDEPLYFGVRVYERSGSPYPFVSAPGASIDGGYFLRLGSDSWESISKSGTVLVQAVIDCKPEEMPDGGMVTLYDMPNVVAPSDNFSCKLYFHNLSGHPVSKAVIDVTAGEVGEKFSVPVEFATPVAPFDSSVMTVTMPTGAELGAEVPYSICVASVDGVATPGSLVSALKMHVTEDAFLRIPLVEEFTSQYCENCPFMAYYLDKAIEEYTRPIVFMTRHAGFMEDAMTNQTDRDLLYLFGEGYPYNPAVMYDRRVEAEVGGTPIHGANQADTAPYKEAIEAAYNTPALARIIVNADIADGKASASVEGRIAKGVDIEGLYLSTCLIENDIPLSVYPQLGLDPVPDGAPEDLVENYRHNGVVRHSFNIAPLGDLLKVEADGSFKVDYEAATLRSEWNSSNMEVVAFISRVNKENLADNYVLNAGGNRWNSYITNGVQGVYASETTMLLNVNSEGRLILPEGVSGVMVFTTDGRSVSAIEPLPAGLFIVTGFDGTRRLTGKLLVR